MAAMLPRVGVLGAGIAGLTAAHAFADAGFPVVLHERAPAAGRGCSFYAGGMIAPWCEAESSEPELVAMGLFSLRYWQETVPVALANGSLLVAPARDLPELARFARATDAHETLDADGIAALEPDLAGRFSRALFFREEAHLDPRVATADLARRLAAMAHVTIRHGTETEPEGCDWIVDCRGHAARDRLPDLRGVKGEMLVLHTRDIAFSRPVQLLHPRNPVYIVPRGDGRFMVGATTLECEERGRVRARALLDLIGAAFTIHPAFGEAEVVEMGCDLRPAFPDNMPAVRRDGRRIHINGLYRHGFLVAPALAARALAIVEAEAGFLEDERADQRQRQSA